MVVVPLMELGHGAVPAETHPALAASAGGRLVDRLHGSDVNGGCPLGGRTCQNGSMAEQRRFLDPSQPQTLQGAVMLCYITAVFGLIWLFYGAAIGLVPVVLAVGGYGIANERRWGYWLATVAAVLNLLSVFAVLGGLSLSFLLNLLFAGVLVALLLHPQSRHYQRIWFH